MDDNCGELVECMGVASGCDEQESDVASGNGWNLWVWLLGAVVRRYIDFLILLIPTPLVFVLFYSSIPTFCTFIKCFSFLLEEEIEKERRRRMPNSYFFYFAWCVRKLRYSSDIIHSFHWKSAVEHVGSV